MVRTRGTRAARMLTRFNPRVSMSNTALHKSMAIVAEHISTAGSAFSTGHSTFRTSALHAASIAQTPTCCAMVMRHHTTVTQRHRFHALLALCHLQVRAHRDRRAFMLGWVFGTGSRVHTWFGVSCVMVLLCNAHIRRTVMLLLALPFSS